jgi:hypothetical protein
MASWTEARHSWLLTKTKREGSKRKTSNSTFVRQAELLLFEEKQECGDTWGPGVKR